MPRSKKLPGTAVDKRNGQKPIMHGTAPVVPKFKPPPGLTDNAKQAWEDYWVDRPALLLTPASKNVLVRWIEAVSRYERAIAEADMKPTMSGQNTTIANPMYRIAEQALKTIESCEKQLGIGTLNATNLGIAALAEQQRLSDLNARYAGSEAQEGGVQRADGTARTGPSGAAADEQDPRLLEGDDLLS